MSAGTAKHPLPPPDQAQPSAKSIRIVVPPTAAPTLAFGEFYSADNEPQDEPQAEQTYYPGNNDCPSHQQFTLHSIITLYDIPPPLYARQFQSRPKTPSTPTCSTGSTNLLRS